MPARLRSIRHQVLLFTSAISLTVLLITGTVLLTHHLGQTRVRLSDAHRAITQITAANASAALAFRDVASASEALASLRHDPIITSAVLYDLRGREFVTYGTPLAATPDLSALDDDVIHLVDVRHNNEVYGRLLVVTDYRAELRRTTYTWALVFGGAVLLTTALAYVLSILFQRAVATPLADLAQAARAVTARSDYAARAKPGGPVEIAAVSEAFNTMLVEIGRRDTELARQLTALDKEMHEREAAETSLRQSTRDLLRLSHEAGMAEVATGVLHNIGNALNSINVSTELLADHLRTKVIASTHALRDFFKTLPPKAAPVFEVHPDGPALLAFVRTLTAHTAEYLDAYAQELTTLRTGVSHLKDIVVRQQSLAKSSRHNEIFDLREALQEALLLDKTLAHAGNPGLKLEQTCEGPSLVYADRSAAVQILVNLLANARAAVAGTPDPRIRVRIGPPTSTHLAITIIDNGVGIAPDQLISIFSYGFTTKAAGHGFGLHNAANTARLLGGALRVHSDGQGQGATFTLELPLHSPPAHP